MTVSKLTMLATAIAFLSFSNVVTAADKEPTPTQQTEIDKALSALSGVKVCEDSTQAKNSCTTHCTAAGIMPWGSEGTCSNQEIWDACRRHCNKDWIKDCSKTAKNEKNNLKGETECPKPTK